MNKIEELFEWQKAIDTKDTSFVPTNYTQLVGKSFIVKQLVEPADVLIGDIITLETDQSESSGMFSFKTPLGNESLFWCEVKEYDGK